MRKPFFTKILKSLIVVFAFFNVINFANSQVIWEKTNGPYEGTVFGLISTANGNILAGTAYGGVYISTDNGFNWTVSNSGMSSTAITCFAKGASNIYAGTQAGVFLSSNNGNSWVQVNTGLTSTQIKSLAVHSNGTVFAGTDGAGIFRLQNSGGSWTRIVSGLTTLEVYSLAISSEGIIFAGTWGGGVFRSTDNGDSWTAVNTNLNNPLVWSLMIYNNQIFAGTFGGGIYKSTNNGDDWSEVNQGLTNLIVYCFAQNSAGDIFAGTDGGGVYRTTDEGNHWFQDTIGLTDTRIWSLIVKPNGFIYAGSYGNGVFKSVTSTPVENVSNKSQIYLEQNFPNPFNQMTKISFRLPDAYMSAKIEISDIMGNIKKIFLVSNDDGLEVDLSGLENGIYFYTLVCDGKKSQTRMMTIIR